MAMRVADRWQKEYHDVMGPGTVYKFRGGFPKLWMKAGDMPTGPVTTGEEPVYFSPSGGIVYTTTSAPGMITSRPRTNITAGNIGNAIVTRPGVSFTDQKLHIYWQDKLSTIPDQNPGVKFGTNVNCSDYDSASDDLSSELLLRVVGPAALFTFHPLATSTDIIGLWVWVYVYWIVGDFASHQSWFVEWMQLNPKIASAMTA